MPTSSGKTTGIDLSALLEGLIKAGVEFILVGGLAAVVQGAPVTTMDVDIVHNRSSENIAKLLAFLKSIDAFHRRPDDKVIEPKEGDISGMGHALFTTRLGPLDVLAVIEEGKTYEDLLEHTVEIEFRGHTVRVLDLKTLVELKRTSRDPKDRQRLPVLEETLRQVEEEYGTEKGLGRAGYKDDSSDQ
ncbi:MAG: hypothetical protein JRI58_13780 [Deltaproteobacteria bacterium]|nr:hypothetical protein [Deltaproteobacteria bacterium]